MHMHAYVLYTNTHTYTHTHTRQYCLINFDYFKIAIFMIMKVQRKTLFQSSAKYSLYNLFHGILKIYYTQ